MVEAEQEYFVYPNHKKSNRSYTSVLRLSQAAQAQLKRLVQGNRAMATIGSLRISQTGGFLKLGSGEMPISVIDVARNNTEVYRAINTREWWCNSFKLSRNASEKAYSEGKCKDSGNEADKNFSKRCSHCPAAKTTARKKWGKYGKAA